MLLAYLYVGSTLGVDICRRSLFALFFLGNHGRGLGIPDLVQ